MLDDGILEIEVHPRSPAYKARLRSGDLIKPIIVQSIGSPIPLESFDTLKLPAGTEVGLEFYRPGATGRHAGWLATYCKLAPWPRTRQWETRTRIASGRRVKKPERSLFLAKMLDHLRENIPTPSTRAFAFEYLSLLLLKRDNDNHRGVWESYSESAQALGITSRTINDLAQMLRWFGAIRLVEGPTPERNSNLVEITWPATNKVAAQPAPVPAPPVSSRRVRF